MTFRREARVKTLQFLFQCDLNPCDDLDLALEGFWHQQSEVKPAAKSPPGVSNGSASKEQMTVRRFADELIRGVLAHRGPIDHAIQDYARNWDLNRMAVVDRNLIRLGVYEMRYRNDIPPVVSINEAVDIAKRFSTEDSGKFVNGILDRVRKDLDRPSRIPV